MKTVADVSHGNLKVVSDELRGRWVIAWGFGRMRAGRILGIGPKNATLELQANNDGRTYRKPVAHSEVFIVPDGVGAERIADLINGTATASGTTRSRRRAVNHEEAVRLAAWYRS